LRQLASILQVTPAFFFEGAPTMPGARRASAASGKAHNVALVACARKLLIYANTVVQRGSLWTERSAMT
jgi:hypothetical protein